MRAATPRWLHSISLRTQWAAVLAVFAIAILSASGVVAYRITYRSAERDAVTSLQAAAAARRELIASDLQHRQQRLATAADGVENSCDAAVIDPACARSYLRKFLREEHAMAVRMWYGKRGTVTVGNFSASAVPAAGTAAFERTSQGRLVYSLRQENAEYGIVLQEQLNPAELAGSGELRDRGTVDVFVRAGGQTVALFGGAAGSEVPPAVARACAAPEEPVERRGAGEALYVAMQSVHDIPDGCVVAARPASQVMAPVERLKSRLVWLCALFSGIAMVLAWVLSSFVTRPLTALRHRLKQLENGDFADIPVVGAGEVRDFSEAFARMAESLRHSRAAVVRSEKRLALAYRAARLWIWDHRLDTGVVTWRDARQGTHTTTFRAFLRTVHPEDRATLIHAMRTAREGGSYRAEYRMAQRGATYRWVYSWGQITLDEETHRRVLVGVTADVSSNKEAERLRAEKERLTASSEMASALAHEINNPLTAVTGAVYMARTRQCAEEQHRKYLAIADEQARRIAHIVRQLLAIYRPQCDAEAVDLGRLLETVIAGVAPQLEHKRQQVLHEIEPRLRVQGHAAELRHAFTNLLTNAMESSPAGVPIRVRARLGRSWKSAGVRGVRIVVHDRGPGIDPARRERVFEPFVGTKAERGTGLGLWVTRSVVLKHGGSIRLRSSQGENGGTCVAIFLPARPANPSASQAVKIA